MTEDVPSLTGARCARGSRRGGGALVVADELVERLGDALLAAAEADVGGRVRTVGPVDEDRAHAGAPEGVEAPDVGDRADVGQVARLEGLGGAVERDRRGVAADERDRDRAVGVVADAVRAAGVVERALAGRRRDHAPVGGVGRVGEQLGHGLQLREARLDELLADAVVADAVAEGVEHLARGVDVDGDEAAVGAVEHLHRAVLEADEHRHDVAAVGVHGVDVAAREAQAVGRLVLAHVLHAAEGLGEERHLPLRLREVAIAREARQLAGPGDDDLRVVDPERGEHVEALPPLVGGVSVDGVELLLGLGAGELALGDVHLGVGRARALAGLDHVDRHGDEGALVDAAEGDRELGEGGGGALGALAREEHDVVVLLVALLLAVVVGVAGHRAGLLGGAGLLLLGMHRRFAFACGSLVKVHEIDEPPRSSGRYTIGDREICQALAPATLNCYHLVRLEIQERRGSQVVRQESAKLLCVGSIPTHASKQKTPLRVSFVSIP